MRVEDIEQYGRLSLEAVLAGVDQADANRQIPLLRSAIDLALDRVATAEHAYYDFLAECALLAAQNMQDVRLHDVERRLQRLESPERPGLGEVVIETAIIFGVELIFTVGAPWIATPVFVFLTSGLIARSGRVNAKRVSQLAATPQFANHGRLETDLASARFDLGVAKRSFYANVHLSDEALVVYYERVRKARAKVQGAQTAVELAGLELAKADKVIAAYYSAVAGRTAKLKSKALTEFLNGATGHTLKGRLGESSGQQVADLLSDAFKHAGDSAGVLAESPFLSSTVLGTILSHLRDARVEAARGHSYTRLLLHQIDDAAFATDATAQDIARGAFDAITPLDDALAVVDAVRPVIVRGFEALLWYEWLSVTGALVVDTGKTFDSGFELEPGELHDGYLTNRLVRAPSIKPGEVGGLGMLAALTALASDANYVYEGDFYHGVRKLSEAQATYLYDTFAAPYFAIPENASLLPFPETYEADHYGEALKLAPRSSAEVVSNFERERRLDQMRVMVVIFFNQFIPSLRAKASYGVVSDSLILVDDYLSQLPAVSRAAPESGAAPTPEQIETRLNALFGHVGVIARHELGLMLTAFEGHMTQLEQRLWIYELVHSQMSYEAAEAPNNETAADAEREINALKLSVEREYQQLSDLLKAAYPETLTEFAKLYEARKNQLTGWPLRDPAPAKFRFP